MVRGFMTSRPVVRQHIVTGVCSGARMPWRKEQEQKGLPTESLQTGHHPCDNFPPIGLHLLNVLPLPHLDLGTKQGSV